HVKNGTDIEGIPEKKTRLNRVITISAEPQDKTKSVELHLDTDKGSWELTCLPVPTPTPAPAASPVIVLAKDFNPTKSKNVALGGPNKVYGADVLLNAPPYKNAKDSAEFDFNVPSGGTYKLYAEYAVTRDLQGPSRPVQIVLNGLAVMSKALKDPTGC